ncbi:MAG: hypothetical protein QNJ38_06060 [Prochloraceae cyanobacterium]|nr:hypothetical protein [Prochloraceae cyanobacterium]
MNILLEYSLGKQRLIMYMANQRLPKYLGLRLQQAGLISAAQIQIALQDQMQYNHLELEEILSLRGWLKAETIDFFSTQIIKLIKHSQQISLIKCLKQAGLLTEAEIESIVKIQKDTGVVFDSLAVSLGYIKQSTLEFFKKYLVNSQPESKIKNPNEELDSQDILESQETIQNSYEEDFSSLSEEKTVVEQTPTTKIVNNSDFFDPKITSSLKLSLPQESFLLSLRLNQAALISESQIEVVIQDCSSHDDFSLEEILVLRGWVKQETIAFFLEVFPKLINEPKTITLAECLERSAILSKQKVANILEYQKETGRSFYALVLDFDYVKESTLKFFMNYLVTNELDSSSGEEEIDSLNKSIPTGLESKTSSDSAISQPEKDNHRTKIHWSEAKTIISATPL